MYPDSILFFVLPLALYAGLLLVPQHLGPKVAGISMAAAFVFLMMSLGAPYNPSFNFERMFQAVFATGFLGAACGGLTYHLIVRRQRPSWIWRGVGCVIGIGVTAVLALAVASVSL